MGMFVLIIAYWMYLYVQYVTVVSQYDVFSLVCSVGLVFMLLTNQSDVCQTVLQDYRFAHLKPNTLLSG